jgi:hypothetical protein
MLAQLHRAGSAEVAARLRVRRLPLQPMLDIGLTDG